MTAVKCVLLSTSGHVCLTFIEWHCGKVSLEPRDWQQTVLPKKGLQCDGITMFPTEFKLASLIDIRFIEPCAVKSPFGHLMRLRSLLAKLSFSRRLTHTVHR